MTYTVQSEFLTYAWDPIVVGLRVDPAGLTMNPGDVQQFTATAIWSDGTETDVTADPNTWWYSDTYWGGDPSDTMLFDNNVDPRGQGTALNVSTPGYVNADYYDNLFGNYWSSGITVDIILGV